TLILMLTAKTQTSDKIEGLNIGADSYLTKPFDPDELIAQVKAVFRRINHHCKLLSSDGLTLKLQQGEVYVRGEIVNLTKHEYNYIHYLMKNTNVVYSKEELVSEFYSFHEKNILDRTSDANIKKLREKGGDIQAKPQRIVTLRGRGDKCVK